MGHFLLLDWFVSVNGYPLVADQIFNNFGVAGALVVAAASGPAVENRRTFSAEFTNHWCGLRFQFFHAAQVTMFSGHTAGLTGLKLLVDVHDAGSLSNSA